MKALCSYIVCLFLFSAAIAQVNSGSIKGVVLTSDGNPAEAVSIQIKTTKKGTVTDEKGRFEFNKLSAGNYTLTVSITGYQPIEEKVVVEAGKAVSVSLKLTTSDKELSEVIVVGGSNKFARKETDNVARLPLKNLENPQVYNVISKEIMQEQMVVEYKNALTNIAGATPVANVNGAPAVRMRGFHTGNNVRNGLAAPGSGIMNIDPVNIERVEAIKGPTGTLFGANTVGTYGGLLNRVIKKPLDYFKGEVGYSTGSWGLNRLTVDVNAPLNASNTVLLRVNGALHKEKGFKDFGDKRNFSIAPSLTYKINDRLTFNLDIEYGGSKRIGVFYASGDMTKSGVTNYKDLKLDYRKSYIGNNLYENYNGMSATAQMNYKMSDKWTSSTNYSFCSATQDRTNWLAFSWIDDSLVRRNLGGNRGLPVSTSQLQQNFTGDFNIGRMRNRIVLGADLFKYDYSYNGLPGYNIDTINLNKPSDYTISATTADALMARLKISTGFYQYYTYSAYVSDVLNITPTLMAMLSARVDVYDYKGNYADGVLTTKPYTQTSFSPKLGLVYQPIKDQVALFANYMSGMTNLAPVTQPDGNLLNLKPQQAWQWEVGAKVDIWKNKVSATFSYYDILVTNATRAEVRNNLSYTVQDGEQRSKGYEVELIANPIAGLNITTGYGYNTNKYVEAAAAVKGKSVTQTPANMANLWLSYKLMHGSVKGLGIGFGGNYVSSAWFDAANTFIIPEYTVVNATVFYDQPKYRLGIKVDNIGNKKYWDLNGTPNPLRQLIANVVFKF